MAEPSSPEPPTRVLLAVNQSSIQGYPHPSISSLTAFDWIIKKLIRPASRKDYILLILHVQVPDEDAFDDMDSLYASPQDFMEMKHKEKLRGLHLIQKLVKRCHELELLCEAWIKEGDPKEIICKEVHRVHPDILVVGSRGLGALRRIFVGTVSEYCATHADCPVLVIKRRAEDAPDDPTDD